MYDVANIWVEISTQILKPDGNKPDKDASVAPIQVRRFTKSLPFCYLCQQITYLVLNQNWCIAARFRIPYIQLSKKS